MKTIEIKYTGQGSEEQIKWAIDIFNSEIVKIEDLYNSALLRVKNNTMPIKWAEAWKTALNDDRVIKMIKKFASQSASVMIDYKGLKTRTGTISVSKIVEKVAIENYNK